MNGYMRAFLRGFGGILDLSGRSLAPPKSRITEEEIAAVAEVERFINEKRADDALRNREDIP